MQTMIVFKQFPFRFNDIFYFQKGRNFFMSPHPATTNLSDEIEQISCEGKGLSPAPFLSNFLSVSMTFFISKKGETF